MPVQIKKTTGDGSVTSAGTKRAGTASSINGRSTANSTVASSTTSLKDDRGGSSRRRQLNEVKPRKHASAASMSLDSSGFVTSVNGNNDSRKASVQDATTAPTGENTTAHEPEGSAAVSSVKDAGDTEVTAADDEYNDDFEHPAENNSSVMAKSNAAYDEEVFEGDEEVLVEVTAVGSGSERPPQQGPVDEPVEDDVYDADFEQTTVLHAPQPTAAQPVSTVLCDKSSSSPPPVEDIYDIDFEQNVSESAAPPKSTAVAQQADVSIKEEDTAYGDDFEVTDKDNTAEAPRAIEAPAPTSASGSVAGSSKTDVDKFLDSVKLRTDLVEAPASHTGRSVLSSEGITTDIRRDEDGNNHTATAAEAGGTVPSTVRSELDAHGTYVSAPHSHTNSFLSSDLESEEPRPERTTKTGIADAEVLTVAADSSACETPLLAGEAVIEQVASADEPIDEILYIESTAGGEKAGEAISNNYLNSPQRTGVNNNSFEEAQGSAVSSPGGGGAQNNNFPDEEIGEEIE